MSTQEIKHFLHESIETVDEKFLNVMFSMLQSYINNDTDDFVLSKEQKAELDRRVIAHKNGTSKSYSWEDVKKGLKV